jgi:uncharacterized protein (TIGR03435 family)
MLKLYLVLAAGTMFGQTFEDVSIKPSLPLTSITPAMLQAGKIHVGMTIDGAKVDIGMMSLAELIRTAYDVKPYQVSGPDWMETQRFDIIAKLPKGASKDQAPGMLRALLADRFKMTVHREKRDHPIYALVVAEGGSKLKTATGGPTEPVHTSMTAAGQHIEAQAITLPALADLLAPLVDRPVVDLTGLKGTYQLTIDIPTKEVMAMVAKQAAAAGIVLPPGAAAPADPAGGTIFQTVQQFGLKLDPRKEPVDVIVIDHLEKAPTE